MVLGAMLTACGGGGSSGDVSPHAPAVSASVTGPNIFLLFPNPQILADGTTETNTVAYAEAYYAAIDPKTTRTRCRSGKPPTISARPPAPWARCRPCSATCATS